jgi:DNA (cytosine-5)-methyltransferase 3A
MKTLSLFDGISCGMYALQSIGITPSHYYAAEIDGTAIKVSQKNYPEIIRLGDVTQIDFKQLGKIDLLIGGSPCQDLSCLKNGAGLEGDKSRLFFKWLEAKQTLNPTWFLLENVVPRRAEWKEQIDQLTGVKGVLINSDLFTQQNRPRVYWTNIPIATLPDRPDWQGDFYQYRRVYFRKNKSGVCPCLTANMGTGGHNVPLKSEDLKDKLTPEDCEALQGLPQGYTQGVSKSARYKALGNGWTVPVIAHILKGMKPQLTS